MHKKSDSAVPLWWPASLAVACLIAITSCGEKVDTPVDIAAGQNITVPGFQWRIRTEQQLQDIYRDSGMTLPKNYATAAFVGVDPHTGRKVIYTTPPKYVDDKVTRDLGHEVMHLALGDYHKAKQ